MPRRSRWCSVGGVCAGGFSALRYAYATAVELGMGERMALIPAAVADPKNMFGALRQSAPATASHGAAAPGLEGALGVRVC